MAKPIKLKDLYVGQLITRGEHTDAQVYTIADINRLEVLLKWKEGNHDCQQWSDYSDCYVPTIKQIEYSISQNGALFVVLIWKSPTYSKYFVEVDGKQDLDLGYSASENYMAHKAKAKYPAAKVLTTRNKAHPCNN